MSNLGSLSHCLVDSDAEALSRAQKLRRKALGISLALEGATVAALLLWPLITPGVLPRQYNVTPTPPYRGGAGASHPHETLPRPPLIDHHQWFCTVCAPPVIPTHAPSPGSDEPPVIDGGPNGPSSGGPNIPGIGPGIPGGFDFGSRQPVIRPLAPPPEPRGPVRKPAEVMQAMLVHQVQPAYPKLAIAAHISGTVELRAIIGKDGVVHELQVLSGHPLLAQAARSAVIAWRYRPTLLNGEPVEVETFITVNFFLN